MKLRPVPLALAVMLMAAAPAPTTVPAPQPAPEALTLRLPDLGPNYELGSSRCGERSRVEKRWWLSTLPGLADRFQHRGCTIAFGKSWPMRGALRTPDYVMSAAFVFADAAGPVAALQRPRAVAARILDAGGPIVPPQRPRVVAAGSSDADRRADLRILTVDAALGDELRVLRLGGYPKPGTVLLWRSGAVLALTLAAGPANDRTTQAALRLAAAQQARIATPTPLLPADLDDVEVPLDDPGLGVPVAWLGSTLPGASGRPPLALLAVDGPQQDPRFEPRADLQYESRHPRTHVNLSLWKPRPLRRQLRRLRDLRQRICIRRHDASTDSVHATVLAYYIPPRRRCGPKPPNGFQAIAFLHGLAVTIEAGGCYRCRRRSPYDSVVGLRALVRALSVREPTPTP